MHDLGCLEVCKQEDECNYDKTKSFLGYFGFMIL